MSSIHVICASTSGNSEHVVDVVSRRIAAVRPDLSVEVQRAERAGPDDLRRGDLVILASGTWNTGGKEGQLNPHMHALLEDRAKGVDLGGKPMTFISLGDERYYFRTRCTEHFLRFQRDHRAALFAPPLVLVNEPYGQEEKICQWTDKILAKLSATAEGRSGPSPLIA